MFMYKDNKNVDWLLYGQKKSKVSQSIKMKFYKNKM